MTETSSSSDTRESYKRTVVLIPGFDPRGASHYHKMLGKQFEAYGKREGLEIGISPRKRWGQHWHRWAVATETCRSSFFYAEWDDLVRKGWHRSRLHLFIDSCRTYTRYLSSFYLLRCSISTSYSQIAFYYPLVSFLLLYALLMSGMGIAGWHVAKFFEVPALSTYACLAAGILCAIPLAHACSPLLNGGWLLRIFCFTKKIGCEGMPEWEERAPALANELARQINENPPDELLIVGHSVGATMAIVFLEELLKIGAYNGKVSYLGMGQCVQLVSFLQNDEGKFNISLRRVAESPRVEWVDFTMPSDGACIALQDPVRASLRNPPKYPQPDLPKFLSPRFMEGYSKQSFKRIKRDRFEYHFQYYRTPEKAAQFEFAAIVLGNKTLAERFAHRKNQARNRPR
jgi:hypothetical protein